MLVMFDVTNPVRVHTMTKGEGKAEIIDPKWTAGTGRGLCACWLENRYFQSGRSAVLDGQLSMLTGIEQMGGVFAICHAERLGAGEAP